MTDLEHRLQHAARELREVEIEPPPLASLTAPRHPPGLIGRVPALVMPVVFVLSGLAIIAGGMGRHSDVPDAAPDVAAAVVVPGDDADGDGHDEAAVGQPALTARQEVALISSLTPTSPHRTDGSTEPTSPANDVRTMARRYR